MAKAKPAGLPELSVDTGNIVDEAKKATEARAKVTEYTTVEKKASSEISILAEMIRQVQEKNTQNYVGIIRVTGEDQSAVRVEFRMENGSLDINQEDTLNNIFGGLRPLLWRREKVLLNLNDPMAEINRLIAEGKNPLDYLNITPKAESEGAMLDSPNVTTGEALIPVEGFLNTLNDNKNLLQTQGQKEFVSKYLTDVLKPRVVLGTKGKA